MATAQPAGRPRPTMTKDKFLDEVGELKTEGAQFVLGWVARSIPSRTRAAAIAAAKAAGYGR